MWDAYREEVEAWAGRQREKRRGLDVSVKGEGEEVRKAREMRGKGRRMVEDGGEEGEGDGDLFEGVPVGIREFMGLEKRLRERREGEGQKR